MRIISDYNDYYDSVQKLGQDQSVIYLRKTESFSSDDIDIIKNKNKKFVLKTFKIFCNAHIRSFREMSINGWWERYEKIITKDLKFYPSYHLFYFCGKIYSVILLQVIDIFPQKYVWLFNVNDLNKFIEEYKVYETKEYLKNHNYYKKSLDNQIYRFNQWFMYESKFDIDWFIENKVISLLLDIRCRYFASESNIVTINPCLKNIEFYKVMDSYTVYQELDMYISGTLSYPQNAMVEVSDEQKVLKHGFDPKYGFRKRKNKNA